jgi:hypothetical protein
VNLSIKLPSLSPPILSAFTPYPLFVWYLHSNEILLNLSMKCWNSVFNAQGLRVTIVIVQVGMEYFLLISWCQIICVKFQNFMVVVFMVSFFKITCASFEFFMVIGITFLGHMCHFSWLKVYYFMVTCYPKMCNAQVKRRNNTICTSIISWCSFHDVKSITVNFQNFMVLVFLVQIFMVCYFEVICRRFQFSMVANAIFFH